MTARLTKKQKKFVAGLAAGMTKVDAVKNAYDIKTTNYGTIKEHAQQVAKSPAVMEVLEAMNVEAQESLKSVLRASTTFAQDGTRDGASYAGVAVTAANTILDRLHGKARQQIDVQSTAVNINVDLSSDEVIDI